MLLAIAIVLFVLWNLCFLVFRVASGLIHVLVIVAIILAIWLLVRRR